MKRYRGKKKKKVVGKSSTMANLSTMKRARLNKKQKIVGQPSSSMENLPSHILIEIISRLPIKNLMAIRCVCKSLFNIVSDSHFQTLYSTRAPTELLFSGTCRSSKTLSVAEYVFVGDSVTTKSNVVFELPRFSVVLNNNLSLEGNNVIISLVNSCNGLVCFKGPHGNRFAVICNPFTREYITVPCPPRYTVEKQGICYGLGFSAKDKNFKLLRLIFREEEGTELFDEESRIVGEICTFGERFPSWRRVANCPDEYLPLLGLEKVVLHEGTLHWYCTSRDGIITFDFDTELFGKLETPAGLFDVGSSRPRWSSACGVFENRLCISGCVGNYVDVWALEEYGQDSWTEIFSIQKTGFGESYEPFKYLENGKVLMFKDFGGIVCFNPDTGRVKKVGGISNRNAAVFIRPSLVSLKILLGDNVKVHSVESWDSMKEATSSENEDSQECMAGRSAARSSLEASTSTSHPTEENVEEDVVPAISESQQGGADAGSFGSQDVRLPEDRCAGQSSSETQKLVDEIESLKAENERLGKVIAKLKQRKKKDHKIVRSVYQQMLNMSRNMPDWVLQSPDDSSSSDDDSD